MSINLNKTKCTVGQARFGFMSPQLQIQITPLHWQLSVIYQRENGIPNKIGFGVGPVAVVLYFGKWDGLHRQASFNTVTSISKKKAENGR